jgi:hypothetical protein
MDGKTVQRMGYLMMIDDWDVYDDHYDNNATARRFGCCCNMVSNPSCITINVSKVRLMFQFDDALHPHQCFCGVR